MMKERGLPDANGLGDLARGRGVIAATRKQE
jgi:hypothetical protein